MSLISQSSHVASKNIDISTIVEVTVSSQGEDHPSGGGPPYRGRTTLQGEDHPSGGGPPFRGRTTLQGEDHPTAVLQYNIQNDIAVYPYKLYIFAGSPN